MPRLSKLQIPNPLPRSQSQPPICNRHRRRSTNDAALDVGWHIVTPLVIVPVNTLPILVLNNNLVERVGHVLSYIWIAVFIKGESAGGVLDEEGEETDFIVGYFRE